jgi:hypothetical protein
MRNKEKQKKALSQTVSASCYVYVLGKPSLIDFPFVLFLLISDSVNSTLSHPVIVSCAYLLVVVVVVVCVCVCVYM